MLPTGEGLVSDEHKVVVRQIVFQSANGLLNCQGFLHSHSV